LAQSLVKLWITSSQVDLSGEPSLQTLNVLHIYLLSYNTQVHIFIILVVAFMGGM
jgi:hypothetical protein